MQWRRSTVRPLRSVRRPSSKTWRKTSQSARAPSRTRRAGGRRTAACAPARSAALPLLPRRVAQESLEALRGLVLAHVEAEEPVLRAEDERAERLCDLGLARPVGPTKRKTPSGRVGSVSPAFTSAIRSTRHSTASGWPSTREREVLAHEVEAERRPRVEHVRAAARWRRSGSRSPSRVDRFGHAPLDAVPDELEDAQDVARRGRRRQVVGGEVERLGQRVLVDLDPWPPAQSRATSIASCGSSAPARPLRTAAPPRPVLEQELVRAGSTSPTTISVAGLDVREQRVEEALRALRVLAGPERLLEAGEEPCDPPPPERERSRGRGPRASPMYIWPAFTSAAPAWNANPRRRAPERLDDQRRLADARSPTSSTERGREAARAAATASTAAAARADERRRGVVLGVHDPPERAEEADVDRLRPPLLERRGEGGARLRACRRSAPARGAAGRRRARRDRRPSGAPRSSPGLRARSRSPARAGCRSSPPPPTRARPGGLSRRRRRGREEQLALAPLAALEPGFRARSSPAGLAPVGNRDHRRRAEELRAP